jgi:hypothetical protein
LTSAPPAAGKVETVGTGGLWGVVVVVVPVVPVDVVSVPVPPASARVGSTTAAANPATARRTEAITTRRLTY